MVALHNIKTHALKMGVSVGVSGLLLGALFHFMVAGVDPGDRPDLLGLMRQTALAWSAGYLLMMLVQTFFRAVRYRVLLAASKVSPLPDLLRLNLVTLARNMFVDMLPARLGELSYVAMMRLGCHVDSTHGISSLVVSFVFDLIALCGVIGAVGVYQAIVAAPASGLLTVGLVLTAVLPALLFLVFSGGDVLVRAARRWVPANTPHWQWALRGLDFADHTVQSIRAVRRAGIFGRLLVLSMVIRTAKYAGLLCLFQAITRPSIPWVSDLPVAHVFSALLSAEAAAAFPVPSFMAFGTYEIAGSLTLTVFGLSKDTAAVVMLALHILSQMIDYTLGALGLMAFVWLYRRPVTGTVPYLERSRRIVGVLVLMLVVAAVALVGWQYRQYRKTGAWAPPDPGHALIDQRTVPPPQTEAAQIAGFMVWSSNRSGNHDIWRMSLPDRSIERLTRHPHTEYYPRISPDGRRIVFSRSRIPWVSQRNRVPWDTIMLEVDTGQETLIAEWANTPSWSAQGDQVFFQRNGNRVVGLHWTTGHESVKFQTGLSGGPPASVMLALPSVSPDLSCLAVTFVGGLRVTALYYPDGRWQKVGNGCELNWGPDGTYLYDVAKGGRQITAIYRIDADTLKRRLWLDLPGEYSHEYFPKVSNDGAWLVFGASGGDHEHDVADYEIFLWKIGAAPNRTERLTFHSGNDCWPDIWLSPSGNRPAAGS